MLSNPSYLCHVTGCSLVAKMPRWQVQVWWQQLQLIAACEDSCDHDYVDPSVYGPPAPARIRFAGSWVVFLGVHQLPIQTIQLVRAILYISCLFRQYSGESHSFGLAAAAHYILFFMPTNPVCHTAWLTSGPRAVSTSVSSKC